MFSGEKTAERRSRTASAEDHVQSGTDAEPGNGVQEQRIRIAEQEIGVVQRLRLVRDPGENLVSKPQGQRQEVGEDSLRPADQVR